MLTRGNAAKLYCLQLIDDAAARAQDGFRIVDLGCGDGRNFVELLRRRPEVTYVGVEPSRGAADAARRALPRAEIVTAPAYDFRTEPADAVVSFSVLEHVVDRARYFAALSANVAPAGRVYMNYDRGHFTADADLSERAKAAVARALARVGRESRYRAPVSDDEVRAFVAHAGLVVADDKGFNTDLKLAFRDVPVGRQDVFMELWLRFELGLNDAGMDFAAPFYRTRNLLLARA